MINAQSKRQTAVSHSTPEADMIATDLALRVDGYPGLDIAQALFRPDFKMQFCKNNEAFMKICKVATSRGFDIRGDHTR